MKSELTRIANPIYDGPFKYLLDDNRVAKLFLSTIIGENITHLTFRPTEHRADITQRSVTVFRMDFSAQITLPNGENKLVIIEIQKAKFATDIMRFRKYLATQYASKENTFETNGRSTAMPILSIYFLGHSLEHTKLPLIRVVRQYQDGAGNVLPDAKETFIESLTHDSFIVQIPHLKERRKNDIESLLGIFDQSQKDPQDAHSLSICEEDYPEKFQPVIRRLIKAISEPQVRETMEVEDDYLENLEDMERTLATLGSTLEKKTAALEKKTAALEEKEVALKEKTAALKEKDAALEKKDAALEEKDAALKGKDAVIQKAIQSLCASGMSEEAARAMLLVE